MTKQGAIVTWARGGSSLNAIRSLGMKGIRVIAIDFLENSPGFHSKYTYKAFLCPNYYEDLDAYAKFLRDTCYDENCAVILPMDEVSIYVLSKYSSNFSNMINVNWINYNGQLEEVQDKEKLYKLAEKLSIPIPKYFVYKRENEETENINGVWVLKSKTSLIIKGNKVIKSGIRYASNIAELNRIANEMISHGQDPIIQEYIPGEGYGYFALYNKGSIRASFQHHRLRESPYFGGVASNRESVYFTELENEGVKIPEILGWHGPLMVEFKRDARDGKFKLMEVNPRFWGSLNLAISSGVDFPYLFYKMATEGECDRIFNYKVGVKRKNLDLEISHLYSLLKDYSLPPIMHKPSFWKAFLSILASNFIIKDDYISIGDLSPLLYEALVIRDNLIKMIRGGKLK